MTSTTSQAPAVRVLERHFGYVIAEDGDRFSRETLSEAAMRFAGLLLVLSAYAQWLLPASIVPTDALILKALMSLVLGASGVILYRLASRGLAREVEVDLTRRELRLMNRNARGQRRMRSATPMRAVASAFIRRSGERTGEPTLYLRLKDRERLLPVASGPEAVLGRLHARLSADLRPANEPPERRLTAPNLFRRGKAA